MGNFSRPPKNQYILKASQQLCYTNFCCIEKEKRKKKNHHNEKYTENVAAFTISSLVQRCGIAH